MTDSMKWYNENKHRPEIRERRNTYSMEYDTKYPEKKLHRVAKYRAKKLGKEFSIKETDITIPDLCPILKQPLIKNTPYAASLDRVDSSKGYIKNNIQVISRRANLMKNDASVEDLLAFAKWVFETYGEELDDGEDT